MTVTFTKSLVMSMVASVRSLSSRSAMMLLSTILFSLSSSLMSCGDSEKKAISEPLAKAEQASSTTESAKAKIMPGVMPLMVTMPETDVSADKSMFI